MKFRKIQTLLLPAAMGLGLAACGGGGELSDSRFPTGSQVMAASSDGKALYVANLDQKSIAHVSADGSSVTQIPAGEQPARIARAGNKIAVTLRGERAVRVFTEANGTLSSPSDIEVGAEPFGIVANEDGTRWYVAVSLEDEVVEIDVASGSILRSFEVKDQPRWLALHPSGNALYIGSAMKGRISWIDLESGDVAQINLAQVSGFNVKGEQITFSPRVTGDLTVSPRGAELVVPMLFVDNLTEVAELGETGDPGMMDRVEGGGYSQGGTFNPVIAIVPVDSEGVPSDVPEEIPVVSVNGFTDIPVNSYPSSATVDPNSEVVFVSIEGGSAVVALALEQQEPDGSIFDVFTGGRAEARGPGFGAFFQFRSSTTIKTSAGPRGVTFTDEGRAHVFSFLDRQVAAFDIQPMRDRVMGEEDFDGDGRAFTEEAIFQALFSTEEPVTVVEDVLPALVSKGRRLFFAANDSRVSSNSAGLSCATCHFDGRNDGLSWSFVRGMRQTPSLAGKVSLTAPVRWEGDRVTVAQDALMTSQNLMGGIGLTEADAAAIEAFIDTNPDVDVARKGQLDEAAERGRVIFYREDVACGSCHNGERLTDNKVYQMFELPQAKTRSLIGVAASAPYLHDGRAETLMDVVRGSRNGSMGNTSMLSEQEMSDLVKYLETL